MKKFFENFVRQKDSLGFCATFNETKTWHPYRFSVWRRLPHKFENWAPDTKFPKVLKNFSRLSIDYFIKAKFYKCTQNNLPRECYVLDRKFGNISNLCGFISLENYFRKKLKFRFLIVYFPVKKIA